MSRDTGKRYSEIERGHIRQLFEEGHSMGAITNKTGCSHLTVKKILEKTGHTIENWGPRISPTHGLTLEQERQICHEFQKEHMGITALTKKWDRKSGTIRSILRRHKVPMRTRRNFDTFAKDAVQMWRDGLPKRDIAKRFRITIHQTNAVLEQQGISRAELGITDKHSRRAEYTRNGYRSVQLSPDDPYYCMTTKYGMVLEHRLVMAKHLGRPLTKGESVHHVDGNRQNNTIGNLQLMSGHHGNGVRFKCNKCGSIDCQPAPLETTAKTADQLWEEELEQMRFMSL